MANALGRKGLQLLTTPLVGVLCLLSFQCRHVPENPSSSARDTGSGSTASATESRIDLQGHIISGPSIPTSGHSTFDYLIARNGGQVPYPFDRLVQLLRTEGYYPMALMIPRGRSLQRSAAKPKFFEFPRLVVVPTLGHVSMKPKELPAIQLESRLFLGFVEPARQIEVISYNEEAGRFEFQLVKDYGAGSTPRVSYAPRAVCIACHQAGAPIFPAAQWLETTENRGVGELISRARGGARHYLDLPIHGDQEILTPGAPYEPSAPPGQPVNTNFTLPALARRLDNSIRDANRLPIAAAEWQFGCENPGDPADEITCRANILRLVVTGFSVTNTPDPNAQLVRRAGSTDFPTSIFDSLPLPNLFPGGLTLSALLDLKTKAETVEAKLALDPLVVRQLTSLTSFQFNPNGSSRSSSEVLPRADIFFLQGKRSRQEISEAVNRLAEKAKGGAPSPLTQKVARREPLLLALIQELGIASPFTGSLPQNLPTPTLDLPEDSAADGDQRLTDFKIFCAECHSDPDSGVPPLLSGTDAEILAKIRADAKKTFERLDWDRNPSVFMPPKNSSQYRALNTPENDARRIAMMTIALQLRDAVIDQGETGQ